MFVNNMQLELITLLSMNKYAYIWIIYSKVCIMFEMCYVLLRESNMNELHTCWHVRKSAAQTKQPAIHCAVFVCKKMGSDGAARTAVAAVLRMVLLRLIAIVAALLPPLAALDDAAVVELIFCAYVNWNNKNNATDKRCQWIKKSVIFRLSMQN